MKNKKEYIALAAVSAGAVAIAFGLSACVSIPKGAKAVNSFDRNKYLGQWYEIARLDFKFERGLNHVTATYAIKDQHTIMVDNRGYSDKDRKWKQSTGKAKLVGSATEGRLKVSFFGPFYAGYNVIAIDPDYRYAMIAGNNLNYLWLLSRQKTMPEDVMHKYLQQAKALGYDTQKLVWTRQE